METVQVNPAFGTASDRRGFFGTLAKGVSLIGLATLVPALKIYAGERKPAHNTSNPDAWFNKINGSHKIVYDATSAHDGFPIIWAWVFMFTNNQTGTPDNDLATVVVFRHLAIALAMEDQLWAKYKLGKHFNIKDKATNTPSVRNPYWFPKEGEMPQPGMSIKELQDRGAMFCVCDMALTINSKMIARNMGLSAEEVKKDWMAGLLPGIQVVPSGVWALDRAQQRGCSYCFAG
jgi:intracellular sulfur oxidation DsrE/DsrF family protein